MYLLDTSVLSVMAPTKAAAELSRLKMLSAWFRGNESNMFLASVTISEIGHGIAKADREQATTKAQRLRSWLESIERFYAGRIMPFDIEAAREAGALLDLAQGHAPGFADIAIAATAKARGLTVLTTNEKDFRPLKVDFLNPFKEV